MKFIRIVPVLLLVVLGLSAGCGVDEFPEAQCYSDGTEALNGELPKCCADQADPSSCIAHYIDYSSVPETDQEVVTQLSVCAPIGEGALGCQLSGTPGEHFECVQDRDCTQGELCGWGQGQACTTSGWSLNAQDGCAFCAPPCQPGACGVCVDENSQIRSQTEGCE